MSSLKIEYVVPNLVRVHNMWDYQPTLISPASIFGDTALSEPCQAWKHELDETFLEMTQKRVMDPMMHILSVLGPPPIGLSD